MIGHIMCYGDGSCHVLQWQSCCVTAVGEQEKAVEFMLRQLLDVLVECVAQCTESLSRLGCSCIRSVSLFAASFTKYLCQNLN